MIAAELSGGAAILAGALVGGGSALLAIGIASALDRRRRRR